MMRPEVIEVVKGVAENFQDSISLAGCLPIGEDIDVLLVFRPENNSLSTVMDVFNCFDRELSELSPRPIVISSYATAGFYGCLEGVGGGGVVHLLSYLTEDAAIISEPNWLLRNYISNLNLWVGTEVHLKEFSERLVEGDWYLEAEWYKEQILLGLQASVFLNTRFCSGSVELRTRLRSVVKHVICSRATQNSGPYVRDAKSNLRLNYPLESIEYELNRNMLELSQKNYSLSHAELLAIADRVIKLIDRITAEEVRYGKVRNHSPCG